MLYVLHIEILMSNKAPQFLVCLRSCLLARLLDSQDFFRQRESSAGTILQQRLLRASYQGASSLKRSLHDREV